jgi:hypothetical protein
MRFLISVLENNGDKRTREDIVWSFDTSTEQVSPFILPHVDGMPEDLGHARGMCIMGDKLVIAFHPKKIYEGMTDDSPRFTDALLVMPIDDLSLGQWIPLDNVNEVHAITALNDWTIALNATTNDTLVIVEFDAHTYEKHQEYVALALDKKGDADSWHFNSVFYDEDNDLIWASAFRDGSIEPNKGKDNGIIMAIDPETMEFTKYFGELCQPHSVCILDDAYGTLCFCESTSYLVHFYVVDSLIETVKVAGYCRGLVQDKEKNGMWVGLSAHRHGMKGKEDHLHLPGAAVQFISHDMDSPGPIDLSCIGPEIFDLLVIPDDLKDASGQ